jgi:predicted transcriptional regulator
MKTTIELPDDLFLKAKVLAAERSTTLKDIMVQALQLFTRSPAELNEKKRKAVVKRLLKAMQASNTEPMVPLKREEIYDR